MSITTSQVMERDIQNFAPRAYAESVPVMLGDQHGLLLSSLENQVALPLIDPMMDRDRKGLIEHVDRYYAAVVDRCCRCFGGRRGELVRQTASAVDVERGYAARGLVEYYMGEPLILEALGRAGFVEVRVLRKSDPWYNLLAKKPNLLN